MMRFRELHVLTLATKFSVICLSLAYAEEQPTFLNSKARLGLIEHARITIDDQVSDNCWTNSSTIAAKTKLALEQNSVSALDYIPSFLGWSTVQINLFALGGRLEGGSCVVSTRFEVTTWAWSLLGSANSEQRFSTSHLASLVADVAVYTSGSNTNQQLDDFFEGNTAEFLAAVLSGRRTPEVKQVKEEYPWIFAPPAERTD